MPLSSQTIKSNDAIGSQQIPITPLGQHEDAPLVQLNDVEDSRFVPQGENMNTRELGEESPEVSENLENSRMDNAPNGKQLDFSSPSPQVSTASFTPQLNVSHTTPPQHTAENSEYAQLLAPKEDENLSHVDVPPSGVQPRVFPPQPEVSDLPEMGKVDGQSEPPPLETITQQPLQAESRQARLQIYQLELKNQELYNDCTFFYSQNQQLTQENQRLNAVTQGLEKTEELKSAFSVYLKKRGKELQNQIEKLANEPQEEGKEQEIKGLTQRLDEINIYSNTGELNAFLIEELNKDALLEELTGEEEQINILNAQVTNLRQQLEAKDDEIAKLQQQPLNAEVEKLKKDLEAKNTEVQQLQKEKKELEAQKQPTEQSEAPTYTAAAGFGLAAGLAAFIALERTVRLDIWATVGIALASALLVSGATYLALKPSTQMNEAGTQKVNGEVPAKS